MFRLHVSRSIYVYLLCAGDPSNDASAQSDPFKTLFAGRIVSDGVIVLFTVYILYCSCTVCFNNTIHPIAPGDYP